MDRPRQGIRTTLLLFVLLCLGLPALGSTRPLALKGQLTGWLDWGEGSFSESRLGLRYIPELSWTHDLGSERSLDLALALEGVSWGLVEDVFSTSETELYRGWVRYGTPRMEIRAGLQKLDFGPAFLLRSLRWFDRIDPRDPLQLTEGVNGLLGRFYFKDNANLWLWGLIGDDEPKGLETIASEDGSLEVGGRFQRPAGNGELAFTYHHRRQAPDLPGDEPVLLDEDRFALDGKWDVGAGIWFEAVLSRREQGPLPLPYRRFLTLGADYTLPYGTGVHVLGEHLWLGAGEDPLDADETAHISALSTDFGSGLLNRYSAIVSYDWERDALASYISWGRIYDNWSFYLNAYDNPETPLSYNDMGNRGTFGAGRGVQILVVFNH